jgi:hypothetical protein
VVGGLLQTAFSLAEHSYVWKIKPSQEEMVTTIRLVSESPDRLYVVSIWISAVVSLAALPAWLYVWRRNTPRSP